MRKHAANSRAEADYWNNRVIVSDEIFYRKRRDDRRELASIIYKNSHILYSDKHPAQKFNYIKDKEEIHGINLPDKLEKFYRTFIGQLQGNSFEIWQALSNRSSERIKYNPATIKQLKSLGYIE